jgi:hypothetical protein
VGFRRRPGADTQRSGPEHLEEVTKEMLSMGSPRLRAVSRPDGSWDDVTFEPLLMPARDYLLRPAGPVYRIPARRVRVLDPA